MTQRSPHAGPFTLFGERKLDSPFVFTAFVALKEKAVPFTFRLLDLAAGEQRSAEFGPRSLTRRVPTLAAGEFVLSESVAIAEYLDDTLLPPAHARLLPSGVEERARARQVLGWLRSDLAALRRARPSDSIFFEHVTTPFEPDTRRDVDKLIQIAGELVGTRASLFDTWSIADADLAFMLMRLHANGDALPAALASYAEAQWRRPSVATWVELARPAPNAVIAL